MALLLLSILLFCVNIITAAKFNDFKLCVQLSEDKISSNKGEKECTDWLSKGDSESDWASDSEWHDPEYIRIGLKARDVPKLIDNIDFRFCIQVTDHSKGESDDGSQKSDWECTNWATKGEDWSSWAYDDNKYDFDSVRVKIETKKVSNNYIKSVRAGVRAANKDKDENDWSKGNGEKTSYMLGSSSKDESWSDWAHGPDESDLDIDALRIFVDAEFKNEISTGGAGICGKPVSAPRLTCSIKDPRCNVQDFVINVDHILDSIQAAECEKKVENALAPIYKLDPDNLDDLFTSKNKDKIKKFFEPYLDDIKTFLEDAIKTVTDMVAAIEISASAHAGGGATSAAGIVLEFATGELYFYWAACAGFKTDVEVGVGISLIFFDSIDSVSGQSHVFNAGMDLTPVLPVGADVFIITDTYFIPIGFGGSVGVGEGVLPVEVGAHECLTSTLYPITSRSSSLKKDAVLLNSFKDVGSSNRDGNEIIVVYNKWVIMVLFGVVCLMLINIGVCFKIMRNNGGNESYKFVKVNVTDSEYE